VIESESVFLFISPQDLDVLPIVAFIFEYILTVISPRQNVIDIFLWRYPCSPRHVQNLSYLPFYVKKIEPSQLCFMYRHGQKVEKPSKPPMGLTILVLSSGAAYLRWLVEIDKCVQRK